MLLVEVHKVDGKEAVLNTFRSVMEIQPTDLIRVSVPHRLGCAYTLNNGECIPCVSLRFSMQNRRIFNLYQNYSSMTLWFYRPLQGMRRVDIVLNCPVFSRRFSLLLICTKLHTTHWLWYLSLSSPLGCATRDLLLEPTPKYSVVRLYRSSFHQLMTICMNAPFSSCWI